MQDIKGGVNNVECYIPNNHHTHTHTHKWIQIITTQRINTRVMQDIKGGDNNVECHIPNTHTHTHTQTHTDGYTSSHRNALVQESCKI